MGCFLSVRQVRPESVFALDYIEPAIAPPVPVQQQSQQRRSSAEVKRMPSRPVCERYRRIESQLRPSILRQWALA